MELGTLLRRGAIYIFHKLVNEHILRSLGFLKISNNVGLIFCVSISIVSLSLQLKDNTLLKY